MSKKSLYIIKTLYFHVKNESIKFKVDKNG